MTYFVDFLFIYPTHLIFNLLYFERWEEVTWREASIMACETKIVKNTNRSLKSFFRSCCSRSRFCHFRKKLMVFGKFLKTCKVNMVCLLIQIRRFQCRGFNGTKDRYIFLTIFLDNSNFNKFGFYAKSQ